ncbi:hypothetical protein JCM5350_002908 [Sporobolomyces pararoseus]
MNDNEPTHFNVLVVGTGLAESILAASLSKSGYSVLQLDSASYYGTEHASLSLTELDQWLKDHPELSPEQTPLDQPDLLKLSQRFALSLFPVLLRATGPGIDLLVRSKVATYLQFGLLGGVGLCCTEADEGSEEGRDKGKTRVERVPASKADVFNDPKLSLVEKRRLTKLLLFAAGQDSFEDDKVLAAQSEIAFVDYLKKSYNLGGNIAESLAYALALCSAPSDPALPALRRLRSIIHSVGRYGPSPYLVGHYGGAGDLVGGFSRICAVWGGGQILGRPLSPLDLQPPTGTPVPASQPPFMVHENPPPPPSNPSASTQDQTTRPLGIPVQLEEGQKPTTFTGDWVISSPHLLSTLLPSTETSNSPSCSTTNPSSINLVAIISHPVPFPRPPRSSDEITAEDEETPASLSDSNLFVFPPSALNERVGTVTALQLGKGTMSCPDGYLPEETGRKPLYTASYFSPTTASPSSLPSIPANLLVTPSLPSAGLSEGLITALDEVVEVVERMFWKIVGEEGKKEGVEFFRREVVNEDEDE